ncbi:MAG TPA: GNAT family N-acetyltransferase [Actinomycetota bacterium]|nr:GNAT family N-acetyltransferase [Actinomycetota bacterium]
MDLEIRTITEDERAGWIQAAETAFSSTAKEDEIEAFLPVIEVDRSFATVDGSRIVGTSASITFRMMVPGGARIPTAGVTMVGVHPTHRRRGINTRMMRAILDQAADRAEPLAALFASEGAIYGRFGYGLAGLLGEIRAESARTAFVRGYEPRGRVDLLPKEQALPLIDRIYDAALRPGGVERNLALRDQNFATVGEDKDRAWMYAVHLDESGEGDAYAVYWVKHDWTESLPAGTMNLKECVASTPSGYADIWRYLFDVDLVATVEAWNRPVDEPLLHLLREPRRLRFSMGDGLWLRLVDVVASLEARRYAADGRVVFEIEDPFRPETSGTYELIAEGGAGRSARTDAEADLSGSVNVLGATYLGGTSFQQLAWAGQVVEHSAGALDRANAMFASTPAPWCVADF